MNGPKFRFTIVMGFILLIWWGYSVVKAYLVGEHGLNFVTYVADASFLMSLIGLGYAIVWLMLRATIWHKNGLTGFEPSVIDEYGTKFEMGKHPFPLRLSRLLPAHMEALPAENMTQLEFELIGFLNSLRHLKSHFTEQTIYAAALQRWEMVRKLPQTNPYFAYFALSLELGVFYTVQEKRQILALKQFWKHDLISTSPRTELHGGLSAFILSVLPSFRDTTQLDSDTQAKRRALLAALQVFQTPELLPANVHPLGRELLQLLPLFMASPSSESAPSELQTNQWIQDISTRKSAFYRELSLRAHDIWSTPQGWLIVPLPIFWETCAKLTDMPVQSLKQLHNTQFVVNLLHMLNDRNISFRDIFTTSAIYTWTIVGQIRQVVILYPYDEAMRNHFDAYSQKLTPDDQPIFDDTETKTALQAMSEELKRAMVTLV